MDINLTPAQILCLQLIGYSSKEIFKVNNSFFTEIIKEKENAEELLEKSILLLKKQEKLGIRTIPYYDSEFPDTLKEIGYDCPPLIHLCGNISLLYKDSVAIIGARQADKKGCETAYTFGAKYAREGYVVISGLALGCDSAAHQGCLAVKGDTIAVVATGLDITHPKENKPLQDLILANGGILLSEQVIGVKANPTRLVARNRLQAALSQKVIVAQCPAESGTMHTVRFAQKYKKEIYASTYKRYDANSSGNKFLIEEGVASPL